MILPAPSIKTTGAGPSGSGSSGDRLRVIPGLFLSALLVLSPAIPATGVENCQLPQTVDLITAASRSDVRGVIEYEVIAENRAGFGKSVAASRRIWGDVMADRWIVTASRAECPETPGRTLGDRWYVLIGIETPDGGPAFGDSSQTELSDLERGALASIVGDPVVIDVGRIDRTMAWLRVNWWLLAGLTAPLVGIVAVIRRRREGARRDYLF